MDGSTYGASEYTATPLDGICIATVYVVLILSSSSSASTYKRALLQACRSMLYTMVTQRGGWKTSLGYRLARSTVSCYYTL